MTLGNQDIIKAVDSLSRYQLKIRRYLHENPELSGKEVQTSKFLKQQVKESGLSIWS